MSPATLSYDALVEENARRGNSTVYWFMKVAVIKAQAVAFRKWLRYALQKPSHLPPTSPSIVRPGSPTDEKANDSPADEKANDSDDDVMSEEMEMQRKQAASFMRRRRAVSNNSTSTKNNSNPVDAEKADVAVTSDTTNAQKRIIDFFNILDKNGDGQVSKVEIISAIRNQDASEVSSVFHLPTKIRQEDGSRDLFMKIFHEIDADGSGDITMPELLQYFEKNPQAVVELPDISNVTESVDDGSYLPSAVEAVVKDGKQNLLLSLANDIMSGVDGNIDEIISPINTDVAVLPPHVPMDTDSNVDVVDRSPSTSLQDSNVNIVEKGRKAREKERASGQRPRQLTEKDIVYNGYPSSTIHSPNNNRIPTSLNDLAAYAASVTRNHHLEHLLIQHKQRAHTLTNNLIDPPRRKSPRKDGQSGGAYTSFSRREVGQSHIGPYHRAAQRHHIDLAPNQHLDTSSPHQVPSSHMSYQPMAAPNRYPTANGVGDSGRPLNGYYEVNGHMPRKHGSPPKGSGKSSYLCPTSSSMHQALDVKNMLHSLSSPVRYVSPGKGDHQGQGHGEPVCPGSQPGYRAMPSHEHGGGGVTTSEERPVHGGHNGLDDSIDSPPAYSAPEPVSTNEGAIPQNNFMSDYPHALDTTSADIGDQANVDSNGAPDNGNAVDGNDDAPVRSLEDQLTSRQRDFQRRNQRILSMSLPPAALSVPTAAAALVAPEQDKQDKDNSLPQSIAPLGEYTQDQYRHEGVGRRQHSAQLYVPQPRHQSQSYGHEGHKGNVHSDIDQSDARSHNPPHESMLHMDSSHNQRGRLQNQTRMTDRHVSNRISPPLHPNHPNIPRSHNQHPSKNYNSNRFIKKKPAARAGFQFKSPGKPIERAQWALFTGAL